MDIDSAKMGKRFIAINVWSRGEFPLLKNCCHMGFPKAVNDSMYASLARLIIGPGYTPLGVARRRAAICIPAALSL